MKKLDLAKLIGISSSNLSRWMREGTISELPEGWKKMEQEELQRWIDANKKAVAARKILANSMSVKDKIKGKRVKDLTYTAK